MAKFYFMQDADGTIFKSAHPGCGMDMVFHCVSSLAQAIGRDYKTLKSEIV